MEAALGGKAVPPFPPAAAGTPLSPQSAPCLWLRTIPLNWPLIMSFPDRGLWPALAAFYDPTDHA